MAAAAAAAWRVVSCLCLLNMKLLGALETTSSRVRLVCSSRSLSLVFFLKDFHFH